MQSPIADLEDNFPLGSFIDDNMAPVGKCSPIPVKVDRKLVRGPVITLPFIMSKTFEYKKTEWK